MKPPADRLRFVASEEVQSALKSLPAALRTQACRLVVVLEDHPSEELIDDGIEPDTLGLFVGDAWQDGDNSAAPLPPQIILYVESLWAYAEENEATYRVEVRRTYLHELGHYLGLDEDDLELRGLE
ncbi:MAG TPA: metallopeptidase family protein [Candidatus Paceibacterota bacterium]|nr:metallopeptidase family protein [Verrucomicrobiota bacterium]HRY47069.1 metallopeptidase family protein [Candidatus Paceibacterota bacterium]